MYYSKKKFIDRINGPWCLVKDTLVQPQNTGHISTATKNHFPPTKWTRIINPPSNRGQKSEALWNGKCFSLYICPFRPCTSHNLPDPKVKKLLSYFIWFPLPHHNFYFFFRSYLRKVGTMQGQHKYGRFLSIISFYF